MSEFILVWSRIEKCAGQTSTRKRGEPILHSIASGSVHPYTINRTVPPPNV